jgi:hypothetical protein
VQDKDCHKICKVGNVQIKGREMERVGDGVGLIQDF